jgi:hypothetical protein
MDQHYKVEFFIYVKGKTKQNKTLQIGWVHVRLRTLYAMVIVNQVCNYSLNIKWPVLFGLVIVGA